MSEHLLFIKSRRASFIELDQRLLAERFEVHEIYQPGHFSDPRVLVRQLLWADVVVGWWASWHTFLPFLLARLIHKPSLLIVGGFDTAAEPEFDYGYQLGGLRARMSRLIMRCADVLMTNSEYSRGEVARNCGIPADLVDVVYHGVPDSAAAAAATGSKEQLALTVGVVDETNLQRKGLVAFAAAARKLPQAEFVVAGKIVGDAGRSVEAAGGPNVRLAGWVSDGALEDLYTRAGVYVQASKHEGFGVSVAEAMLHRCVPVVTRAGALPEVVGDTGLIVDSDDATVLSSAIGYALGEGAGDAARERVLQKFSVEQRQTGLYALVDRALASRQR